MEDGLISPSLLCEYRRIHAEGYFQGRSITPYVEEIGKLIDETAAITLLDYGCGKGLQYKKDRIHERWGIPWPTLYDPAIKTMMRLPQGRFDGVICSDVAEHIEEELVPAFFQRLFDYADKFLFVTVCCRPAEKFFADGRNLHVTVKPPEWWQERFDVDVSWRPDLRAVLRFSP